MAITNAENNSMKTLTVQQPWASLICSGIMNVLNMTWTLENPCRILIHADSKSVPQNFFDKQYHEVTADIFNNITYGNIESIYEMPTNAIIGFVDVVQCTREYTHSKYDSMDSKFRWKLDNAYMFNEPIVGLTGESDLFEYEMNENDLPPYHKVSLRTPEVIDNELVIPVSDNYYDAMFNSNNEGEKNLTIICDGTNHNWIEFLEKKDEVVFVAADMRPAFIHNFDFEISVARDDKNKAIFLKTVHEKCEPLLEMKIFFW